MMDGLNGIVEQQKRLVADLHEQVKALEGQGKLAEAQALRDKLNGLQARLNAVLDRQR